MSVRHFLLTQDDAVEEFTAAEAAAVAEGRQDLPRFADKRLRYVQVDFDDTANEEGEIHVRTLGAIVRFDTDGRLAEADRADQGDDALSAFEHDACVQFALRDTIGQSYALN
jgi:hypothetical protein